MWPLDVMYVAFSRKSPGAVCEIPILVGLVLETGFASFFLTLQRLRQPQKRMTKCREQTADFEIAAPFMEKIGLDLLNSKHWPAIIKPLRSVHYRPQSPKLKAVTANKQWKLRVPGAAWHI